jgi:hypothetical protein
VTPPARHDPADARPADTQTAPAAQAACDKIIADADAEEELADLRKKQFRPNRLSVPGTAFTFVNLLIVRYPP